MKAAISGASGFIGGRLTKFLQGKGYETVALNRKDFCPGNEAGLKDKLKDAELIFNLAGVSLFARWTKRRRRQIYESRVETTRRLVEAMNALPVKPDLFVSTSAVGYYPDTGCYTEHEKVSGTGFLSEVCEAWETEARRTDGKIRTVITRLGVVLSDQGGILPRLILPFRWGFGARVGDGKQYFSWIHIDDLLRIYELVMDRKDLSGVINCVAPGVADNAGFTRRLAAALHRRAFFRIPARVLRLFLKGGSVLITHGQCALPDKLLQHGFMFRYPELKKALNQLLS